MKETFLIISIIFGLIGPIVGVISILKGEFKPQRMTRFIFLILTVIYTGTLFFSGTKVAVFLAAMELLSSITIFILAIKYGIGGYTKFDLLILGLSLISMAVWQTTQNNVLGLVMAIVTDVIGFTPTYIKMFKQPFTEDYKFYFIYILASGFNLLALKETAFMDFVFPTYIFIVNVFSVILILTMRKAKGEPVKGVKLKVNTV